MITLADEYTTGSSIMPQKKNPDVAELARGRTGRVYGTLIQLLTTMKSLPMGYNRDLQEDKPMLWDAFDTVKSTLKVVDGMLSTAAFNKKRMAELAGANFTTSTEFANYLVREKNMPFRESHRIVGNIVRALASAGKDFSDISAVKTILAKNNINVSETGILQTIDPIKSVQTYSSTGSSSPEQTSKMASTLEKESQKCLKLVLLRRTRIQKAQELTEKAAKSYIA